MMRRLIRSLVDLVAIGVAVFGAAAATGDNLGWMISAGGLVAAYGLYCWIDGAA